MFKHYQPIKYLTYLLADFTVARQFVNYTRFLNLFRLQIQRTLDKDTQIIYENDKRCKIVSRQTKIITPPTATSAPKIIEYPAFSL